MNLFVEFWSCVTLFQQLVCSSRQHGRFQHFDSSVVADWSYEQMECASLIMVQISFS